MQDCPELQRVTTEYVVVQDRIRISGAADGGETVVLWLTLRMLNRLVPRLTKWLEQQGVAGATAGVVDNEMLQGFAQEAARSTMPPLPAVQPDSASTASLVDSVDIATGDDAVALIFKTGDAKSARLTLASHALRQWLGIVHDQYVKGEWPTTIWPVWMEEARQATALASVPATLN